MSVQGVTIVQKSGLQPLAPAEEGVLQTMFGDYARLAVEAEFGMGFSGCRVFRVRPVEAGGSAHRPALVKIGPAGLIEQEWLAYETRVKNTIPRITRVISSPLIDPDTYWAGLRYELVGGGIFEVKSLSQYYREATIDDLLWVLRRRLFPLMSRSWWLVNRADHTFQPGTDYDHLLPVNYLVRVLGPAASREARPLTPHGRLREGLRIGDQVRLEGFMVTGMNPGRHRLTLNLPRSPGEGSPDSFRLRVEDVPELEQYRIGDRIQPVTGQIVATRRSLLVDFARGALGSTIDLSEERHHLAGGEEALNPLFAYEEILSTFIEVNLSTVHRDFNLENILVDPETRDVKLIDFATVGPGHNLHDLLRLEAEVVTKFMPEALAAAGLPPETMIPFYLGLDWDLRQPGNGVGVRPHPALEKPYAMLQAIRREARKCSFDPENPAEHYRGLAIYLLGALKFKNLDEIPGAKAAAYWGAAAAVELLHNPGRKWAPVPKVSPRSAPAPIVKPTPRGEETPSPRPGLSWKRMGGALGLLLAIAILVFIFWPPPETVAIGPLCAIDRAQVSEIGDGPAAAGDLLHYFALANPALFDHMDRVEAAYLAGDVEQDLTYIWGSPGIGKSFISRNRLRDGFPGDTCLVRLGDLFGEDVRLLDFEVVARPDLVTLDGGKTFDSLPAVANPAEFNLENLFEAAGCRGDEEYVPMIVVDDIDEVGQETSNLILRSLDGFIMEAAASGDFVHVAVIGRAEGFAPWYHDPRRNEDIAPYLSIYHLSGPEWRTAGDLEVLATDQYSFVLGQETWAQLQEEGTAETYISEYVDYVRANPILPYSIRALTLATSITDRSRTAEADTEEKLKNFLLNDLLRRANEVHQRPPPGDDQYLAMLEEIAALYTAGDRLDKDGYFSVAVDDTVPVLEDGQIVGEVLVSDVLDHSGIATLEPASFSTARYRFDPVWIHQHLVELHNGRVDRRYQYAGCYE